MGEGRTEGWEDAKALAEMQAGLFKGPGTVFRSGQHLYRTTGEKLGHGGMGSVYLLERRRLDGSLCQEVVGKVFHPEYLLQLRTDETAKRDHEGVMRNIDAIAELQHPHLLPTYVSAAIADNYLIISPRRLGTLREVIASEKLSPRRRVELFMQALSGLSALHDAGFLHRDFTIRNILVDEALETSSLFDFDLSFRLSNVIGQDYQSVFGGRVFGSPGYSMAPEVLDSGLMATQVGIRLDLYAVGTTLFSLFTDELPYGKADDMWSLLLRVSEGVVRGGLSHIQYPKEVPEQVRPIVDACMQRNPALRPKNVAEILSAVRRVLPKLQRDGRKTASFSVTMRYGDKKARLEEAASGAKHKLDQNFLSAVDDTLGKHGYLLRRALGSVKGHPIFAASPDPELIAQGRFPDSNTYPKIVTAVDLQDNAERLSLVEAWMSRYLPALREARQGLLTSLHRVIFDSEKGLLLLLSEHVEDARFGPDLDDEVLDLTEVFGLGFLVAMQVRQLHQRGLAHNNVCAQSLLLKGSRHARRVFPAMVGIVSPEENKAAMSEDARQVMALVRSWIRESVLQDADPGVSARLQVLCETLEESERQPELSIEEVIELCGDGLSTIDYNFGVLREADGDLEQYALLLVGHSLYGRLWRETETRAVES